MLYACIPSCMSEQVGDTQSVSEKSELALHAHNFIEQMPNETEQQKKINTTNEMTK